MNNMYNSEYDRALYEPRTYDIEIELKKSRVYQGKYVIRQGDCEKLQSLNSMGYGAVLIKTITGSEETLIIRYLRKQDKIQYSKEHGFRRITIKDFSSFITDKEENKALQIQQSQTETDNQQSQVKGKNSMSIINSTESTINSTESIINLSKQDTEKKQESGLSEQPQTDVNTVNTENTENTEVNNTSSGLSAAVLINELIERTIDDTDSKISEQKDIIERLKARYKEGFRITYTGVRMEYTNLKAVEFNITDPYADEFKYKASCWTQTVEDLALNGIRTDRVINYTGFTLEEVQLLRYEFTKLLGEIRYKEKHYDLEDDKYNLILNFYNELTALLQERDNTGSLKYAGDYAFLSISGKEYLCIKSHRFLRVIYTELRDRIIFEDTAKKMIDLLQGAGALRELASRKRTVPVNGFFNSCYCISLDRIKEIERMIEEAAEEGENIDE